VLDADVGSARWPDLVRAARAWGGDPGTQAPLCIEALGNSSTLAPSLVASYDRFHPLLLGDALNGIGTFHLAIVGRVLEELAPPLRERTLAGLLAIADYLLVVGRDALTGPGLLAQRAFDTPVGPERISLLSREDPRHLRGAAWDEHPADDLRQCAEALAAARAELAAVTGSPAWRTWTRLRTSPAGRLAARLARRPSIPATPAVGEPPPTAQELLRGLEPLPQGAWLALHHPAWLGVGVSTANLFDHTFPLGEIPAPEAEPAARLLLAAGAVRLVMSGFPAGWRELAVAMKRLHPRSRILALWHGNPTQMWVASESEGLFDLMDLCRAGVVEKIGFVKEDLDRVFAQAGIRTAFVMNYLRTPVGPRAAPPQDGRQHLGIVSAAVDWRKNNFAQLAAAALVPGAVVHLLPTHERLERLAAYLGLDCVPVAAVALPREQALAVMGRMHLNLGVTLSECCPMSVLESLSVGVPCLMSATSHLFRDCDELRALLCVPDHDNPARIAAVAERALGERERIIRAYDAYIPTYTERARASVQAFLEET